MADVQEPAAEPSMEEILASIRKIISDDGPPPAEANGAATEVVELTQAVEDDGSVVNVAPPSPAPPMPVTPPPAPPRSSAPAKPAVTDESMGMDSSLVSEPAVSASASAISTLASTVEIERLSSAPHADGMALGNGMRTLEDMALELMRPLLKDWLDKNLPATVDRLVQKEIERISKRAKE